MILQDSIPYDVTNERPLPGIAPLEVNGWFMRDEAFTAQMAERARLIRDHRPDVIAETEGARDAVNELLDAVISLLPGRGYQVGSGEVCRPDGVEVAIDRADPLATLGHLVQEDFCILQKSADEHVLTAAVLCFPASWRLSEKIGRPLIAIHEPVKSYDENIARRVQRLFDGIRVGMPLWRFNVLSYADPTLHQPRSANDPRPLHADTPYPYIRSERQCLLRLPQTQAVVFSIHTFVTQR